MKNKLPIAIVSMIIILVIGGTMGYLWRWSTQQVDQIVAAAIPFADVRYEGVSLSPRGTVSVDQLRITPYGSHESLLIGTARVNTPHIFALVDVLWQLKQNQLPLTLDVTLDAVEWTGGSNPPATADTSMLPDLDAAGCGPLVRFSPADWNAMGYGRMSSSAAIAYHFDAEHQQFVLHAKGTTQDWRTLELEAALVLPTWPLNTADLVMKVPPKLAKFTLALRDAGFHERRNQYCTAKSGKALPEYLQDQARQAGERLRTIGIAPGAGIMAAYHSYLAPQSEWVITAAPLSLINPIDLLHYTPSDAIKMLGVTLHVNHTPIPDLSFNWDSARFAQAFQTAPEPSAADKVPDVTTLSIKKPEVAIVKKDFHVVPLGQLQQYLGKIARLRTKAGAEYKGRLDAIEDDVIKITLRKTAGSATFSLRSNELLSAEVLY